MSNSAAGGQRSARQLHYQPVASHVHPFLVDLWDAVRAETGGRLDVSVHADNAGLKATHAEIIDKVKTGEIELYAVMGSLLGPLAPVFEIQSLPFAYKREEQVYALMDGALGDCLRDELATKGIYAVPGGLMENGFRHISTIARPIKQAGDLEGLRIRVPEGRIFDDTFRSLGAEPTPIFVLDLHRALAERRVDAQENPLAITESLKLYEVTRHVSLTYHMWSGFNLIANPGFWHGLPADVRDIVFLPPPPPPTNVGGFFFSIARRGGFAWGHPKKKGAPYPLKKTHPPPSQRRVARMNEMKSGDRLLRAREPGMRCAPSGLRNCGAKIG